MCASRRLNRTAVPQLIALVSHKGMAERTRIGTLSNPSSALYAVPSGPLIRNSMESVRPVRRSPDSQVSVLVSTDPEFWI